jgi:LDH2 family malate/lactate/ureidoglycolate dehydrogenase
LATHSFESLVGFVQRVLETIGCSASDAHTAAIALVTADLRGIDSHGVARLRGYLRLQEAGRVNVQPNIQVVHETPSTAVIDGDAGLGLVVAPHAMRVAMQKARNCGTGWVSVSNSNHFGIAGYHAMLALEEDMIGIAMTNASALVAPTFSKEKMLGTNPIAVAIPAGEQPPFVADFATTTAANGKLELLQRKNAPTPDGWVQDVDGQSSNDAHILKKQGALLPLGGDREHGSHKGYALGSIVDIFSAVFSGASYGPWAPPFPAYIAMPEHMPGKGLGHFFGAMRIDAFRPAAEFKAHMDNWINRFRSAEPISGFDQVLIPGDPERIIAAERMEQGIPVHEEVEKDLAAIADRLGIAPL